METEDFKFYLPIYVGIINLWDIFVVVGEIFIVADIFIAIVDIFVIIVDIFIVGGEIFNIITNDYWIKRGNASWGMKIWY